MNDNLIETSSGVAEVLKDIKRIAVLGIKTEESGAPAYYVPEFLKAHGADVVPVPVYYPEVTEILGQKVYRKLADIPGEIDLVDVFRRPNDIDKHIEDILAKKPKVVWFQSGIRNEGAAAKFAAAGIKVVQDKCLMVEWRRFRS
jgi:predicted CoA-binding protein